MSGVKHFPNATELGQWLAKDIADRISEKLSRDAHGLFVLGCPGGRSPVTTYQALATELSERDLNLNRLVIAMMDDYVIQNAATWDHVDIEFHYSCRRFAYENIQNILNKNLPADARIPRENIWFPNPAEPGKYDARLQEVGGIDFFILASGSGDGHVAFNPAGTERNSNTRVVELAQQTRIDNLKTFPDFQSLDEVPTHGVTVGTGTIARFSKSAALVLTGSDKTKAFQKVTGTTTYVDSWPATVIHEVPHSVVLVDDQSINS